MHMFILLSISSDNTYQLGSIFIQQNLESACILMHLWKTCGIAGSHFKIMTLVCENNTPFSESKIPFWWFYEYNYPHLV